jgi:hypothetical protein
MADFGEMKIKYRGATLHSGNSFAEIKSALQKYIRRGDTEQIRRILTDFSKISILEGEGIDSSIRDEYVNLMNNQPSHGQDYVAKNVSSRIKAMRTNLRNRLIVSASEDIGIANRDAPVMVNKYLAQGDKGMIRAGVYLARCQKSRLISDYKSWYMVPPYYWKGPTQKAKFLKGHAIMQELFPAMGPDPGVNDDWAQALKNHDVKHFFYYYGKYMLNLENEGQLTDGFSQLYKELKTLPEARTDSVVKTLLQTYQKMTHAERPIYLYHASLLCMLGSKVSNLTIDVSDADPLDEPYTLEDFCIDRHTGRGSSCTVTQFALEGSFTLNKNLKHFSWQKRIVYILFKMIQDTPTDKLTREGVIELLGQFDTDVLRDNVSMPILTQIPTGSSTPQLQLQPQYDFIAQFYGISTSQAAILFNGPTQIQIPIPAPITKIKARIRAPINSKPVSNDCTCCNNTIATTTMHLGLDWGPAKTKAKPKPKSVIQRPKIPQSVLAPVLVPETESQAFNPIARAQLVTSSSKTDVYFATTKTTIGSWAPETRVVVKGPYNDNLGCLYAQKINALKAAMSLPHVEDIICIQLVADLWNDVKGLGVRYSQKQDRKQYFMVASDLLSMVDLPTKMHSSIKWEPTEVIDFDHKNISKYHWDMVKDWPTLSENAQAELIMYHVFRYMVGIGDLADRNFLKINDRVYALDEDAPNKGKLKRPGVLLKKKRSVLLTGWISSNWSILEPLLAVLKATVPVGDRVNNISFDDKDYIIELFSES